MEQTAQTLLLRAIYASLSAPQRTAILDTLGRIGESAEDSAMIQACSDAICILTDGDK